MSKHNYSQYSKKNHNKPLVEDTVTTTEAPVEPLEIKMVVEHSETAPKANTAPVVEPAIVVETVETVALPKTVIGTVVNCTKLNVRSKPAIDGEVLVVLNGNSEVKIDSDKSTYEWLKITTADGIEGFCMRKYVSAKA